MGDHIHPDRKTWLAMQGDKQGPVEMSLDKIKARIQATRAAGAKAGIYMHLTALDDSSQLFYPQLAVGRRVGPDGQPVKFGWNGPDVKGRSLVDVHLLARVASASAAAGSLDHGDPAARRDLHGRDLFRHRL